MPQTTVLTLFDHSGNLSSDNEFYDEEGRSAYYCQIVRQQPISTKITRKVDWKPSSYNEPWSAWLYFTSDKAMDGYIKFGSAEPTFMADHLRTSGDASRYFTGLNGRVYKWEPGSRALHCYDTSDRERLLAIYEYSIDAKAYATLQIKRGAESMLTEIVATLLLNRHAIRRA